MSEPDTCSCFPGTCRGGDVVDGRLASGARCKQVSQADARGDEAMRQWHRECDDGDALLRMLGLDPVAYRTEGGSIDLPKVREAISPRPAPAQARVPTQAMVTAYLQANDAYWREQDAFPTKLGKWRNGTPSEATFVSLKAALAVPDAALAASAPADAAAAVVNAAREWLCERTINDWDEAALARALILLDGDWPGCPDCDHECGEPCVPATVADQLAWLDSRIAQLVHEGKLAKPVGYVAPDGWKPVAGPKRGTARAAAPAGPHVAVVQFIEGLLLRLGREPNEAELRAAAHALTVRADRIACAAARGSDE